MAKKKKLLYVAPHLSTGGMPQYLLKQIQTFIDDFEIVVVEYNDHSGGVFVVQKNQINDLVKLYSLYENKGELLDIINSENPDIIHFHEIPHHFVDTSLLDVIFDNEKRNYNIVVTTHGSLTNPNEIRYHPDRYILVSEWSRRKFEHLGIETDVWEYPIESIEYDKDKAKEELGFEKDWKHVLMVGLFTEGKNQREIFAVARQMEKYKIKFHFVGNQAMNFESYWKPLMEHKPDNCMVWGERNDVDKFYKAIDMFYFSSKLELNPLSVKEALSYGLPSIFRRLHTYLDTYDNNDLVRYIDDDLVQTKRTILEKLNPSFNEIPGWFSYKDIYDEMVDKLPEGSNLVEVGSWSPEEGLVKLLEILEEHDPNIITSMTYEDEMPNFVGVYVYQGSECYDGFEDEWEELRDRVIAESETLTPESWDEEEDDWVDDEARDTFQEEMWEIIGDSQWQIIHECVDQIKEDQKEQ